MAKKVSTAIIGGFVISAIMLLLVALIIFSGGSYFKKTNKYILFFEETVSGLSVGAPVKFRGVEIGSVKSVVLWADPINQKIEIPILIEIDPEKFKRKGEGNTKLEGKIDALIERGLRARLDLQSFVTGQYYIQFDFLPGTPVKLSGTDTDYKEIPTVKSSFTELSESLRDIPIKQTVVNLEQITRMIREEMEGGDLDKIIESIAAILSHADKLVLNADNLVSGIDSEAQKISDELSISLTNALALLEQITADFNRVASSGNMLLDNINSEIEPLSTELQKTFATAQKTLGDASSSLIAADKFIESSEVRFKLAKALEEISAAARSIRMLAEYLERHPESVLQGRQKR